MQFTIVVASAPDVRDQVLDHCTLELSDDERIAFCAALVSASAFWAREGAARSIDGYSAMSADADYINRVFGEHSRATFRAHWFGVIVEGLRVGLKELSPGERRDTARRILETLAGDYMATLFPQRGMK